MARRGSAVGAAVVLVGVAAGVFALGAGGKPLVTLSCGDTVATSVKLDADILNCDQDGLVVTAPNVTIDLNGHTIDGDGSGNGQGIDNSAGHGNVTVKNGTITDFDDGIRMGGPGTGGKVSGVVVRDSVDDGIDLSGRDGAKIEKSAIIGAGSSGITVDGGAVTIQGNTVVDPDGIGIAVGSGASGSKIVGNYVSESAHQGIQVTAGETAVLKNRVVAAEGPGIEVNLSGGNQVKQNTVIDALGDGIQVWSDSNLIEKNTVLGDDSIGIVVEPGADSNAAKKNTVEGGADDGIFIASGANFTIIEGNLVRGNPDDDGVDVDDVDSTLAKNTADANGDLGIEVVGGVTDGGGNKARNNVNALQCSAGIACS